MAGARRRRRVRVRTYIGIRTTTMQPWYAYVLISDTAVFIYLFWCWSLLTCTLLNLVLVIDMRSGALLSRERAASAYLVLGSGGQGRHHEDAAPDQDHRHGARRHELTTGN